MILRQFRLRCSRVHRWQKTVETVVLDKILIPYASATDPANERMMFYCMVGWRIPLQCFGFSFYNGIDSRKLYSV